MSRHTIPANIAQLLNRIDYLGFDTLLQACRALITDGVGIWDLSDLSDNELNVLTEWVEAQRAEFAQ